MNGKDLFIIFILTALCALFFSNFNSLSIQEGNAIFESTKNQYLVSHIVSPRLAGLPLKVFGVVLNTPIVGSFIAYLLYKTNNLDLVQR